MKKSLCLIASAIVAFSMTACEASSKYDNLDNIQSSKEHCEEIDRFVDDYLASQEIFTGSSSVDWVGYSHFKETSSEEDFEAMQLGGYYKYDAPALSGELISARVSCYWNEDEEPTIVDLKMINGNSSEYLVEYSDDKIADCWEEYLSHLH